MKERVKDERSAANRREREKEMRLKTSERSCTRMATCGTRFIHPRWMNLASLMQKDRGGSRDGERLVTIWGRGGAEGSLTEERGSGTQKAWGMQDVPGCRAQGWRKDAGLSGSRRRAKEHREPEGLGRPWC